MAQEVNVGAKVTLKEDAFLPWVQRRARPSLQQAPHPPLAWPAARSWSSRIYHVPSMRSPWSLMGSREEVTRERQDDTPKALPWQRGECLVGS